MQDFKQKLHNYESTPPKSIWDNIVAELDNAEKKVVQIPSFRRKYRFLFYALTAVASLLIIFVSSLFFEKKNKTPDQQLASSSANTTDSQANVIANDSLNNKRLKLIIASSKDKSLAGEIDSSPIDSKKYITIAGPEGQPVKISSKVATLIVSANNDYPPRPIWDKKINKWKEIMLSSTISPTATNLLDIVQLSSMRGDN